MRECALAADVEIVLILLGTPHPGRINVWHYVKVSNIHDRPESNYLVNPLDFLHAESLGADLGATIVGVAHSHLRGDAQPSDADIEMMKSGTLPDWWIWPIYSCETDEYSVWALVDGVPVDVAAS